MNFELLGIVFTISLTELLGLLVLYGVLSFWLFLVARFYLYKKFKKVCPHCKNKSLYIKTETRFMDNHAVTKIYCVNCRWDKILL